MTFCVGYAFANGEPYILGKKHFFLSFQEENDERNHEIRFSYLFALGSLVAQVSVAGISERSFILVPCFYALVMAGGIFPIVYGWTIGGGFLTELGYIDFGGAGPIHVCAGFASLVGAGMIGARKGRF